MRNAEGMSAGVGSPGFSATVAEKPGDPTPADIPSAFRIASRARAYRVTVTVQLPDGGRFAREAVIEPERTAPLGFRVREWTVPASAPAEALELPDGAAQCIDALA